VSNLDTLKAHYSEILEKMPFEFDSHMFILALAQAHQRDYVLALSQYADAEDGAVFRRLHTQISQSLYDYADHIGEQVSPDIFGNITANAKWLKRA